MQEDFYISSHLIMVTKEEFIGMKIIRSPTIVFLLKVKYTILINFKKL
jgi:hypothetical protein